MTDTAQDSAASPIEQTQLEELELAPVWSLPSVGLTEDELEERKTRVGASEVSSLLGVNPWRTYLHTFFTKTGRLEDASTVHEHTRWGHLHEPTVRRELEARAGWRLVRRRSPVLHKEIPGFGSTLDFETRGHADGVGVVQVKAKNQLPEDGLPPVYDRVQLQADILCRRAKWGALAVLVAGASLRVWVSKPNYLLDSIFADAVAEFWRRVREDDVPPPQYPRDAATIIRAFSGPVEAGHEIDRTYNHELLSAAIEYEAAGKRVKEWKERQSVAKAALLEAMDGAEVLRLPEHLSVKAWWVPKRVGFREVRSGGYAGIKVRRPKLGPGRQAPELEATTQPAGTEDLP